MQNLLGWLDSAISGRSRDPILRQLLDYEQPLLRELMTAAPGTFQHSVNVGVLADAAARSIHGHALLARVGALYHDVGKLRAPKYFIENQQGENPHDALPPAESARILRAHVTDGVELVQASGLDSRLADFVKEHHGTGVMRFFYAKATQDVVPVPDEAFRYPGPRPRSPETAIVMIADQLEATARAASPGTEAEARQIVGETLARIQAEDQLGDSQLSRRDLRTIHSSTARALFAMHHHRITYPSSRRPSRSPLVGVKAAWHRRRAG